MAMSDPAGRKEKCLHVCDGVRWDRFGVEWAMGGGKGRQEMTTAKNPLLLRRILLHLEIL